MNTRSFSLAMLSACILLASTGCAVFSKGRSQMVTIRSVPSGATASINGAAVGRTPLKVDLPRNEVYRVELEREGFDKKSALILPVPNEYEDRTFRWGVDYAFGAMTDLSPDELQIKMRPTAERSETGDRFETMSSAVLRADALLASGMITTAEHKVVIDEIINSYVN